MIRLEYRPLSELFALSACLTCINEDHVTIPLNVIQHLEYYFHGIYKMIWQLYSATVAILMY